MPSVNNHSNMIEIEAIDRKSLRDIVLESIRYAIISGKWGPGQHLKERELAHSLGVSTTPVKEALRILSHEGWVETLPRKGTFVSEMVNSSIKELLMLKASLERLAAKLAAMKISKSELEELEKQITIMEDLVKRRAIEQLTVENAKFHRMIRQAARNPVIFQMIEKVVALDNAFRERTLMIEDEILGGYMDHRGVFEAIKHGDPELAEKRMDEHITRSAESVLASLSK